MLKIEIKSTLITEVSGTSKAGKPYHIRKQSAWVHTFDQAGNPQPFPERVEFNLAEQQPAYPVGVYTLSPKSFFVGDFNQLSVGRPILDPFLAVQNRSVAA